MISLDLHAADGLPEKLECLTPADVREARNAAAQTAAGMVNDHFLDLNTRPNKRKWPKRNFWTAVAQTIGTNLSDAAAATISVASPAFWRRWKGGQPIEPKTRKRLAIPAIAEAYAAGTPGAGRVPVELMVIVRKRGAVVALAEAIQRPGKRPGTPTVKAPGRVWYWLVKSANPGPDPLAKPDIAAIDNACQAMAARYVKAILAQKGAVA